MKNYRALVQNQTYQKRDVQTKTAQLLVCIMESDVEDDEYATELVMFPRHSINNNNSTSIGSFTRNPMLQCNNSQTKKFLKSLF